MAVLRFKGDWYTCADYVINDVVRDEGIYYKALQQNAGKKPKENLDTYWAVLNEDEKRDVAEHGGIVIHNETLDKDGTESAQNDDYWGHLGMDETAAAANAHHPSATNPFLTKEDLPDLAKSLGDPNAVDLPEGVTFVYGAHFNEDTKTLAIASDDVLAWYFAKDREWKVVELNGAWRDIISFGDKYVAVGVDCAAIGTPDGMTVTNIMNGDYIAVASSGSKVIAVGDGVQSITSNGTSWDGKAVDAGSGEGVCFDERLGKFIRVGKAGAFAVDGNGNAEAVEGFPDGSWRDIVRGNAVTVACSGKLTYKRDTDDSWRTNQTFVGGWDGIAEGSGFIVGVANGKAGFANSVTGAFGQIEIPSYIYTGVCYGASAFWCYGSKLICYNVRDVAAALNAAEDPNADNPFGTISKIEKLIREGFTEFADKLPQLGDKETFVQEIIERMTTQLTTQIRNIITTDPNIDSLIRNIVNTLVPQIIRQTYDTNGNGKIDSADRADSARSADTSTRADSADSVDVNNVQGLEAYLRGLGLVNPGQGATDPTTLIEALRAFAAVTVNGEDIAADTNKDKFELKAGTNVTLNTNGKQITVNAELTTDNMLATQQEWDNGVVTNKAPSVEQVMQKVSAATTTRAGIAKLAVVPGTDDLGEDYTTAAATPAYVKAVLEAM